MFTLVDSNVILDVITDDPEWADWSSEALSRVAEESTLAINPIIYAEVSIPRLAWLQEPQGENIGPYAETIENLIDGGLAVGGSYVNDLDESGLLVDYIDFLVQ